MKQTAVEWLGNEIDNELKVIDNLYGKEIIGRKIAFAFVKRILIKAKEMEMEQHGKTWDTALDKYEVRAGNYMRAYEDFDEYYNETFKNTEK